MFFKTRPKSERDAKYATFNRRMLAATIDSILIMLFIAPVIDWVFIHYYGPVSFNLVELQQQMQLQPSPREASQLFWHTVITSGALERLIANFGWQMVVLSLATAICWHFWSATPGKMLLRIRIVDAKTEQPISDAQILLRIAGYLVSTMVFLLGFFWIGVDKRRQGWHDKLADTVVVIVPKTPSNQAT